MASAITSLVHGHGALVGLATAPHHIDAWTEEQALTGSDVKPGRPHFRRKWDSGR